MVSCEAELQNWLTMEKNHRKKIAIVGSGISGLLACKHTMEEGFIPIVFEAQSSIGGIWSKTIESTKLQTPKNYYQFSDFSWPDSVKETFPDHKQVLEYIYSYALHFNILPLIKFNSKVLNIDHVSSYSYLDDDAGNCDGASSSSKLWGGNGEPFSSSCKWRLIVQDVKAPFEESKVYEVDFVILCNGKFSDMPNMPRFPVKKGPEVFNGKVMHSIDYSAMDGNLAAEFVRGKRVTIVGFQKSAVDLAAEIAGINGMEKPCTLIFRAVHWMVPENLTRLLLMNLNRFSELMIHKPCEGFLQWLLAFLLFPLIWIFFKLVESYLKWKYPLKKYNTVPDHGFLEQINGCMLTVLPAKFYDRVEEGSLILKKSRSFTFFSNGIYLDGKETETLATEVVIFATGYRSDEKLASIFASTYFQKCITEYSAPFYRECIHPRIPQLAILGYAQSPAILYTTEIRAKWLAKFLAGGFKLPAKREMEEDMTKWEELGRRSAYRMLRYNRSCVSVMLNIYYNDQLCREMGFNPRRKKWFLSELFVPYSPMDYANVKGSMQPL